MPSNYFVTKMFMRAMQKLFKQSYAMPQHTNCPGLPFAVHVRNPKGLSSAGQIQHLTVMHRKYEHRIAPVDALAFV